MAGDEGSISFTLAGGDEVNAFLLDTVVNELLDRTFGGKADGS